MSSVLGYERKIQVILSGNWNRFREFAALKKSVDMDHWATYFAYDVVSELAFGNALGMVQNGGDVNRVMESVLGLFYFASNLGTEAMKGSGVFRKWLTDSVAKRYYNNEKPKEKDMLQNLIEAKDRDGNPNTFPSVLAEAGNVLGVSVSSTVSDR
jgi:hypothetical protein